MTWTTAHSTPWGSRCGTWGFPSPRSKVLSATKSSAPQLPIFSQHAMPRLKATHLGGGPQGKPRSLYATTPLSPYPSCPASQMLLNLRGSHKSAAAERPPQAAVQGLKDTGDVPPTNGLASCSWGSPHSDCS